MSKRSIAEWGGGGRGRAPPVPRPGEVLPLAAIPRQMSTCDAGSTPTQRVPSDVHCAYSVPSRRENHSQPRGTPRGNRSYTCARPLGRTVADGVPSLPSVLRHQGDQTLALAMGR
jgi:hypothetical protein